MHRSLVHPLVRGFLVSSAAAALLLVATLPARAQDPQDQRMSAAQRQAWIARFKQFEHDQIWQGARAHFKEARELAALRRRAAHGDRKAIRGLRVRQTQGDEGPANPAEAMPKGAPTPWAGRTAAPASAQSIPANVRCNNPAGDLAGDGQAEESIASAGNQVVVAWNDGNGFDFSPAHDTQGFAWSNDGGATFTDGGDILHPQGVSGWTWTSDPSVTVNPKTGFFYYAGLASIGSTQNAIGVARGRFTGGVFAFDSAFVVRSVSNLSAFLDKEWIVADTVSGNLYLTSTTFAASNEIDFYRSTNGGRTWSAPAMISNSADNGFVQGSRPVLGPNGELYAVWEALGQGTSTDNFRFRASLNGGLTWGTEVTPPPFFDNFGTGAPGFNRERGIAFPSVAVDRSTGAHRGRIYLGWSEALDFQDNSTIPTPGPSTDKAEVEPNSAPGTATPFTVGQVLEGSLTTTANTSDLDYYSTTLTAGQTIFAICDSMSTNSAGWTMRLFAPDGSHRLAYSGKPDSTSGSNLGIWIYTAPVTGTYYLRMAAVSRRTIKYRVLTTFAFHGAERGRDQSDAFVAFSDDGGNTWSTPTMANDDGIGFYNFLPEVAVGSDGDPYVMWFDHRDETVGAKAHVYMSRSEDGGNTWAANQRVTSAQSDFTFSASDIAPNMGDYSNLTATATNVLPNWADGRGTDVDVWATTFSTTAALSACPSDTTITHGGSRTVTWNVTNTSPLFAGGYTVTLTSQRNWPLPSPAALTVAASASSPASFTFTVPDSAASGVNQICATATNASGVVIGQCCFNVTAVGGALAVGDHLSGLALAPAVPNPVVGRATISYSLPAAGHVRLSLYDLAGGRVRTLADAQGTAGAHVAVWDGTDDRGRAVHAGAFFVRLEFGGRDLVRRLVLVR